MVAILFYQRLLSNFHLKYFEFAILDNEYNWKVLLVEYDQQKFFR